MAAGFGFAKPGGKFAGPVILGGAMLEGAVVAAEAGFGIDPVGAPELGGAAFEV